MKRYSTTETAKLIRQALKQAFPRTVFSVRSKSYSGGSSITAYWTDGPTTRQVNPILKKFEGSGFDGMQDLKYNLPNSELNGEPCEFGTDFVFSARHISDAQMREAALITAFECDLPLATINNGNVEGANYLIPYQYRTGFSDESQNGFSHDSHGGEWYASIIVSVANSISKEQQANTPALPQMVTESYIDAKVREMIA